MLPYMPFPPSTSSLPFNTPHITTIPNLCERQWWQANHRSVGNLIDLKSKDLLYKDQE